MATYPQRLIFPGGAPGFTPSSGDKFAGFYPSTTASGRASRGRAYRTADEAIDDNPELFPAEGAPAPQQRPAMSPVMVPARLSYNQRADIASRSLAIAQNIAKARARGDTDEANRLAGMYPAAPNPAYGPTFFTDQQQRQAALEAGIRGSDAEAYQRRAGGEYDVARAGQVTGMLPYQQQQAGQQIEQSAGLYPYQVGAAEIQNRAAESQIHERAQAGAADAELRRGQAAKAKAEARQIPVTGETQRAAVEADKGRLSALDRDNQALRRQLAELQRKLATPAASPNPYDAEVSGAQAPQAPPAQEWTGAATEAPIGSVRTVGGIKYRKVAANSWVPAQ